MESPHQLYLPWYPLVFYFKFNSLNYILALHFSQGVHILAFYVAKYIFYDLKTNKLL
jgi:hypothetical protein